MIYKTGLAYHDSSAPSYRLTSSFFSHPGTNTLKNFPLSVFPERNTISKIALALALTVKWAPSPPISVCTHCKTCVIMYDRDGRVDGNSSTYSRGDGGKYETLVCKCMRVLHCEHIEGSLGDLVGYVREVFVSGWHSHRSKGRGAGVLWVTCGFSFVKVDCDLHVGNLLEITLFQQREKSSGDKVNTCYIGVECWVEFRPVSKEASQLKRGTPHCSKLEESGSLTCSQFHRECYSMRQHYR